MIICSREEFREFVQRISDLCVEGIVTADYCRFFKVDFDSSRNLLLDSYEDFSDCCTWLSGCRYDEYATHHSPGTDRLLVRVNKALGRSIPHGALIAAVLFLDLPHVTPGNSPGLAVGISRFCARFQAQD